MTGWATYCLNGLARKKQLIEHEVDIRTRELQTQSTALANSNASLTREIAERKLLQERLTQVTDHEQRRLGQELHDSLGQQIAVMALLADSMQLQLEAEHAKVPEPLRRLRVSTQHAQAQVRALTKGLLPREIDHWGLAVALEELAESAKGVSNVTVEFTCDKNVTVGNATVATHLYRIAQEALRNALEHGKVTRTTISLSRDEHNLKLAIYDDGTGFEVDAPTSNGAGLFSMRHRAELIGARLEIQSPEGGGTSVTCYIPIPSNGGDDA